MKRRTLAFVVVWAVGLATGSLIAPTFSAFSSVTSNVDNSFEGASDWVAPNVPNSVIRKGAGGVGGFIKQGGTYRVFADVSDSGNPASGTTSVTADVSPITSGQTAAALSEGSWTVDGVAYNYRSAELTANAILTDGSKSYTVSTEDAAGNTRTKTGLSVTVDNVIPAGSDIQTADGGSTVGRPEQGDQVVYTFTERVEPDTVMNGWAGASADVVVRINQNGKNDIVQVYDATNTTQVSLGSLETNGDYVTADSVFGASGTPSSMVQSNGVITITLGTLNSGTVRTNGNDTILWLPVFSVTDLAGNALSPVNITEVGANDPDF